MQAPCSLLLFALTVCQHSMPLRCPASCRCCGPALCLQAAQYRLELQQLKSEHAALQMLTQHTEQDTVSCTGPTHARRSGVAGCAPRACYQRLSATSCKQRVQLYAQMDRAHMGWGGAGPS